MTEADHNPLAVGLEANRQAPPVALIVFGASGDLTSRKLLPAIAGLVKAGQVGHNFSVVGVARSELDDNGFRKLAAEAVPDAGPEWDKAVAGFRYVQGEYGHPDTFDALKAVLAKVERDRGTQGNRVYYLATVPDMFGVVANALGEHGMAKPEKGFARLVIEKPFGRDGASAAALDTDLHGAFDEDQIYRIDHYLGKETVQNVLALRFANAIFEPVWNRRYVDHVQVTVAESIGVEHRGAFYETAGALRDIVQNHVMQILGLTLLEPPATVDATGIRDEKVKLLRAVEVMTPDEVVGRVVRGQYDTGWVEGKEVPAYRQEPDVSPDSSTDTFVAMRLAVDNWRWAGVPIFVRTGKRLPKRVTEVALRFQRVPHLPFASSLARDLDVNELVVRVQPDEGVTIAFGAKVPGPGFKVRTVSMDFSYGAAFLEQPHDAYERLLLDSMIGDPTLFIRSDEVEQSWRIVDPILEAWQDPGIPLYRYPAGSWGPGAADRLLEATGRHWRRP
ncbi:MAG TPA: glucose-6-phosphate dehydrogenase [Acidimicrobiales bacterium]|nr:glucose-6-phosphate dehydrogenase [Acidimicrobiales bacterium]